MWLWCSSVRLQALHNKHACRCVASWPCPRRIKIQAQFELCAGALAERTREELEWQLRINVIGSLDTVHAYLPQLRQAAAGTARVLITVSTSGLFAAKYFGIYSMTKYAALGLAETLAVELADEGIGVTALLPGPVATTHAASSQRVRPRSLPGEVGSSEDSELVDADTARISPDHVRNFISL
eukprot:SAG31_NODE_4064_length_3624_cov_2.236312_2_plen_183_part_00